MPASPALAPRGRVRRLAAGVCTSALAALTLAPSAVAADRELTVSAAGAASVAGTRRAHLGALRSRHADARAAPRRRTCATRRWCTSTGRARSRSRRRRSTPPRRTSTSTSTAATRSGWPARSSASRPAPGPTRPCTSRRRAAATSWPRSRSPPAVQRLRRPRDAGAARRRHPGRRPSARPPGDASSATRRRRRLAARRRALGRRDARRGVPRLRRSRGVRQPDRDRGVVRPRRALAAASATLATGANPALAFSAPRRAAGSPTRPARSSCAGGRGRPSATCGATARGTRRWRSPRRRPARPTSARCSPRPRGGAIAAGCGPTDLGAYGRQAVLCRRSDDRGVTWDEPQHADPRGGSRRAVRPVRRRRRASRRGAACSASPGWTRSRARWTAPASTRPGCVTRRRRAGARGAVPAAARALRRRQLPQRRPALARRAAATASTSRTPPTWTARPTSARRSLRPRPAGARRSTSVAT